MGGGGNHGFDFDGLTSTDRGTYATSCTGSLVVERSGIPADAELACDVLHQLELRVRRK